MSGALKTLIMNKFTERFFAFPIKIYDSSSLKQGQLFEEDPNVIIEGDWISGIARVGLLELENMSWQDGYSSGRSIDEVREEGFDTTVIYFETHGEYVCTWPRKKFEEKLNDFVAKQPKEEIEEDLAL